MKKRMFICWSSISILLAALYSTTCQKELTDYAIPNISTGDTDTTGNGNIDTTADDDDDNVYYYIRFTVNDVEKEYNAYTKATFPMYVRQGNNLYACQVEGQLQLNGTINTISINLNDSVPVVTGKEFSDKLVLNAVEGVIGYNDAYNNIFSTVAAAPNADLKITLTAIKPGYVTVTFSCNTMKLIDDPGGILPDAAIITNGSFKVKRY